MSDQGFVIANPSDIATGPTFWFAGWASAGEQLPRWHILQDHAQAFLSQERAQEFIDTKLPLVASRLTVQPLSRR
jgi:hypothetical protein